MRKLAASLLIVATLGGSCSEASDGSATTHESPVAVTADGREVFERTVLVDRPGCVTCHSLTPDVVLVGPSLAGLVERAEREQPGVPERYIRESITEPDAVVQPGFSSPMPVPSLTDAEVDALVEYLLEVGS